MASNVLNVAKMDFIVPVLCDLPPLTRRRSVSAGVEMLLCARFAKVLRERASIITTPHEPTVTKHNVLSASAVFPTPVCRFGQT